MSEIQTLAQNRNFLKSKIKRFYLQIKNSVKNWSVRQKLKLPSKKWNFYQKLKFLSEI